jgi:hypothetical protein
MEGNIGPMAWLNRALCLGVCGLGIGWLIGLSVSPTLNIVVTALLTVVTGALSALVGINVHEHKTLSAVRVDLSPVAILIAGIVMGSAVGVHARTNDWFGPDVGRLSQPWTAVGLDRKQVAQRLFEELHPVVGSAPPNVSSGRNPQDAADVRSIAPPPWRWSPGSTGIVSHECYNLQNATDDELRPKMMDSVDEHFKALGKNLTDKKTLRWFINGACGTT